MPVEDIASSFFKGWTNLFIDVCSLSCSICQHVRIVELPALHKVSLVEKIVQPFCRSGTLGFCNPLHNSVAGHGVAGDAICKPLDTVMLTVSSAQLCKWPAQMQI